MISIIDLKEKKRVAYTHMSTLERKLREHPRKKRGEDGLPGGISPFKAVAASIAGGMVFGFSMRQSGVFIPVSIHRAALRSLQTPLYPRFGVFFQVI